MVGPAAGLDSSFLKTLTGFYLHHELCGIQGKIIGAGYPGGCNKGARALRYGAA